jgi:hypothetical protein
MQEMEAAMGVDVPVLPKGVLLGVVDLVAVWPTDAIMTVEPYERRWGDYSPGEEILGHQEPAPVPGADPVPGTAGAVRGAGRAGASGADGHEGRLTMRRVWRTKDGKTLEIRKMGTSHIMACLR